ncbi:hypothetical protein GCM10010912_33650 [Paenibacillus albidus]|uniref:Sulfatase N-terminal domain-containing protein n=1 Tax=Paenibacillus albidus TaxID=2041023 RepID=A0A917CDY0_9BACL|nr:LTA synthase family protein [Paenibacillus albidus]GGF85611.1 hypothetical protein GCM10010912_33650 [Paenibacillus albidus]
MNRDRMALYLRKAGIILAAVLGSLALFLWHNYKSMDIKPLLKQYNFWGSRVCFGKGYGTHLIVVQLESFQNFLIHTSIQGQPLTPVINKLSAESLYFPHIFQQIGRGNTSDAEFISNTSIYPVGAVAMSKKYGDREFPSLARLMRQRGYVANTFHVNDVSFWDRNQMYPALGFDTFYDRRYFPHMKFSRFGASDEDLYRVGINKLKTLDKRQKNFYAQFVTASSHSPFTIPKNSKRLKLNETLKGGPLREYLTAVNYADYALGTFIDKLKETGLWDKSVLVVYGDHFGLNKKKFDAKKLSEALGIPYHKQISTFNVPLMIHLPGQLHGKIIKQTGGQVDILPTVANIMGIDLKAEAFTAFGQDLLNVDHNVVGMRYYLPTGSFFNNEVLFIPGEKGFADGTATSIRTLQRVEDIAPYKSDYDDIIQRMKSSDRYVKQLPIRRKEIEGPDIDE